MRVFVKLLLTFVLLSCITSPAFANSFVVQDIRVEGSKGINADTVKSYLPVKVGQRFDTSQSGEVIRDLYASGFFNDVTLAQEGNVLVVKVLERPVIGSIVVTGNKDIPKDKFDAVLKDMGLTQGRVFNSAMLERVKAGLQNQYETLGKYNAVVTTTVTPQSNNRVAIRIDISEGVAVQIKNIQIIGNKAFSSSKLINEMDISTYHFWSPLTGSGKYSQEVLGASLEQLRDFYLDHGYLKFKVDSAQATLTPDKKSVYVVIHVTEGPVYTVSRYQFAGNLIVSENQLRSVVTVKIGKPFSKQQVRESTEAISRILGNLGYAFASVNPVPDIDELNKQVAITFYVDPGVRVYVRRVNFDGNFKTKDVVFRRIVPQMEGSVVNVDDIKESERRINVTGYTEKVNIETAGVPGTPDEVDLNYHIKEAPSAQATISAGYGTNGFAVTAGINQNNFLGTGNSLGINFNNTVVATQYSISYNDPYYTLDGIQRGIALYYQRTSPGNLNISRYWFNAYGASVSYTVPISARGDNVQFGIGYQSTDVNTGTGSGQEILNFIAANGSIFNQVMLSSLWTRDSRNKAYFPTNGTYQDAGLQLAIPVGSQSLDYYKMNYDGQFYLPLTNTENFILIGRLGLGYGNGYGKTTGLPFFANYYAGGIGYAGQVRGFDTNSLGPKDTLNNALGGNILTAGTLGLIFPNPMSSDKLRTSLFVDAGNVYSNLPSNLSGTNGGPLRYTAGIAVDWRIPVFNVILSINFAKALNAQKGDATQPVSFNFGTNF